jgi:1,4-dihydroxy-2-naphthoate octaprenyltransferase
MAFLVAAVELEQALAHRLPERLRTGLLGIAALSLGIWLTWQRGWPMFWVAIALLLLAVWFAAGPRLADSPLGGPITVLVLGPLASAGAAIALTGVASSPAFWIGVPIGFLADAARRAHVAAMLAARAAASSGPLGTGAPAAPGAVGSTAPPWFAGDLVAGYGIVPALVFGGSLPFAALVSWATLPWAAREIRFARTGAYSWHEAAVRTRLVHVVFGLLLAAAVFATRVYATRSS